MDTLNKKEIQNFYETVQSVWPTDDEWHLRSQYEIQKYINSHILNTTGTVLNAGSGGNTYGLPNPMYHVDIAENKISMFENATVASIERLPFLDCSFLTVICVGSVINYCDAAKAVSELARVLKPGGTLILEFESSASYEYRKSPQYKHPCVIVTTQYFHQEHKMWAFSEDYIKSLVESNNLSICNIHRFHILSGLDYSFFHDENHAAPFARLDTIFRRIKLFSKHAANLIIYARRL